MHSAKSYALASHDSEDAVTGPDTSTLRPWQQSAIGDRRSVVGAIAIALVVAFYVIGIPFLESNVEGSLETDEAGRFVVDDYTTVLVPDGWSVESQSELFTTLTDGTYSVVLITSSETEETSAQAILQPAYDGFGSDPANELTPIETFTTDVGGDAAGYLAVIALDETGNGAALYAVLQNGRSFQSSFTGPSDLSDPFYDEAEAIVKTVEISAEPRSGS
jgi:hypothetical protein